MLIPISRVVVSVNETTKEVFQKLHRTTLHSSIIHSFEPLELPEDEDVNKVFGPFHSLIRTKMRLKEIPWEWDDQFKKETQYLTNRYDDLVILITRKRLKL